MLYREGRGYRGALQPTRYINAYYLCHVEVTKVELKWSKDLSIPYTLSFSENQLTQLRNALNKGCFIYLNED